MKKNYCFGFKLTQWNYLIGPRYVAIPVPYGLKLLKVYKYFNESIVCQCRCLLIIIASVSVVGRFFSPRTMSDTHISRNTNPVFARCVIITICRAAVCKRADTSQGQSTVNIKNLILIRDNHHSYDSIRRIICKSLEKCLCESTCIPITPSIERVYCDFSLVSTFWSRYVSSALDWCVIISGHWFDSFFFFVASCYKYRVKLLSACNNDPAMRRSFWIQIVNQFSSHSYGSSDSNQRRYLHWPWLTEKQCMRS